MSRCRPHPLAVLVACSCLGVTTPGCGSDEEPKGKPLPRAASAELQKRLDEVERRYKEGTVNSNVGACNDIQDDSFVAIEGILADLPTEVDPELRRAVDASFENLRTLTEEGCAGVEAPRDTEPEPEPVPEPEPLPEPAEPDESPTDESPPPTETIPPDEEPPDDGGAPLPPGQGGTPPGKGKGKGKGNGGGAEAPQLELE